MTAEAQSGRVSKTFIPDIILEGSMIRIALNRDEEQNGRYR